MPASILGEVGHLSEAALTRGTATRLSCPSCGSAFVAQVLGDNGGISYVCTACGHSWSWSMGAHRRKCDWCGSGTPIVRDMEPVNPDYQYWCEECARALIIKGDPIETYRELEGEPIYGRLLEEHCTLKRFYSFVTA